MRLTDDVVDIEVQALEGAAQTGVIVPALATGDKVNANDVPFGSAFPYVALPHNSAVNAGGGGGGGAVGGGATSGGAAGPAAGTPFPVKPALGGLAAAVLLGSGVWLLRRRPGTAVE